MGGDRNVDFGIRLEADGRSFGDLARETTLAEELGYHAIWMNDHLMYSAYKPFGQPQPECWTTLTALAAHTRRIRLGTMASCNLFRYPSLVAKMASTLDVICGGRLEFGIGTGWMEREAKAYGITFPSKASERTGRLDEALMIIKEMWGGDRSSFTGEYYRIDGAVCLPIPVQKPHPPIWVGGMGERFTFRVVARHADGCNMYKILPDECKRKNQVLDSLLKAEERRPEEVRRSIQIRVFIGPSEQKALEKMDRFARSSGLSREQFVEQEKPVWGSFEQCVATLQNYVDAGISYFNIVFKGGEELEKMRLFAEKVAPFFK